MIYYKFPLFHVSSGSHGSRAKRQTSQINKCLLKYLLFYVTVVVARVREIHINSERLHPRGSPKLMLFNLTSTSVHPQWLVHMNVLIQRFWPCSDHHGVRAPIQWLWTRKKKKKFSVWVLVHHWKAVRPQTSVLSSVGSHFLIYKMEITDMHTSHWTKWNNVHEEHESWGWHKVST